MTFPLVLPGLLAGGLAVFSLTMGDYITPSLIGGAGDFLVGNIVASQFGVASNWPLGSAFAAVVLFLLFALMAFFSRKGVLETPPPRRSAPPSSARLARMRCSATGSSAGKRSVRQSSFRFCFRASLPAS